MKTPDFRPSPAIISGGGNADVVYVSAKENEDGSWSFDVAVSHPDTGWEDYADGWDLILEDGTVLKPDPVSPFTRLLLHPHIDEQPFTRSQNGILIPNSERYIIVRAHDLVDGYGGQSVVVDLLASQGDLFKVVRQLTSQAGILGLTNHNLDGNRYLAGKIDLLNAEQVDIPLKGVPKWVVGVPQLDHSAIWLVALEDGELQAFQVSGTGFSELAVPFPSLEPGQPPAIRATTTGFELINSQAVNGSSSTNPVGLPTGQIAYISEQGKLILQGGGRISTLYPEPLLDGRILTDGSGNLLVLSEPTSAYAHGVLGDSLEAASFTLITDLGDSAEVQTFRVPGGQVIEGIAPIWTDLNGDGVREIIVTLSNDQDGAQLVVYSAEGELIAQGEPIGSGYRWRHQIAAAPFGPNGEIEIVDVLTPHIGGIVEFFQVRNKEIVRVAELPGFTSHVIYTRNLDLALAADVDADGQVELLLPNQQLNSLAAIQRTEGGAEVAWEIDLNGSLSTNIGAVGFADGGLSLAVGLDSGVFRVWLP